MLNRLLVVLWMALLAAGCHTDDTVFVVEGGYPAPPMGLEGSYFNRAVALYWTLSPSGMASPLGSLVAGSATLRSF